jgi:hypothetical protein
MVKFSIKEENMRLEKLCSMLYQTMVLYCLPIKATATTATITTTGLEQQQYWCVWTQGKRQERRATTAINSSNICVVLYSYIWILRMSFAYFTQLRSIILLEVIHQIHHLCLTHRRAHSAVRFPEYPEWEDDPKPIEEDEV